MTAAALAAALSRIGQVQQHLPAGTSMLMALIAIGAVLPASWSVTRHLHVMAHEGAHATVGSALGVKITGIELRRSGEGATYPGPRGPVADLLGLVAGYLGPTAFGIGAAALINTGYIVAVLWIGMAALVGILSVLRRGFGILTVVVALAALFAVAGFANVGVQVLTAYALTWFLLISGVRVIAAHGRRSGDADALRKLTKIPRGFWYVIWLAGTVAGLLFGATLLV